MVSRVHIKIYFYSKNYLQREKYIDFYHIKTSEIIHLV